ncbi:MAG: outer membrane protein assembly factor BamD [Methylobacteriaceae bacterium]|nr:outer membrane protein assembly factor BamD [Methylobacteriaceae bacterium]
MTFAPFASRAPSALRTLGKAAAAALIAGALAGCSTLDSLNPFGGEKYEQKILPDTPPETMYNQGLARLQKGDAESAAKRFSTIDRSYPQSDWSKRAMLMQTYAEYEAGKYDDAIASANRYVNRFPQDPDAAYATYLAAMSYYQQVPDISRDQERAEKALQLFEIVVQKYPKSEYVSDSKYKIQVTRDQLAGKEMSVGRFYLARRNYTAAINRFRNVVGKYQTTRHTEEALARLTEAYMGLGIAHEAQTAAAVLGHNFPDGQWYKDSFTLLQTRGLEPREDQGSWISRTMKRIGLG